MTHASRPLAQFPVTLDLGENVGHIREVLAESQPGDLVVLPEGALSGYAEDPAFLGELDPAAITAGVEELAREARGRGVHLFVGSCLPEGERWFNAGLYLGPRGERFTYRKVNLATAERGHFSAGDVLPTLDLDLGGGTLRVGLQLCRELRYPEQWQHLARRGAQVFVSLTNAVGNADECPVWRAHLISRAAENGRFVLASNTAHGAQKCPTLAVAPTGRVLAEVGGPDFATRRVPLDLSLVSNWSLDQARRDVVAVQDPRVFDPAGKG